MLHTHYNQISEVLDKVQAITTFPQIIEVQAEDELAALLDALSPHTPWGERQSAARKLGYKADPAALPALLDALPSDPFWMVRCAIIQALERIGDPSAIPTLQLISKGDRFQVVRSYAAKAIKRLSRHS